METLRDNVVYLVFGLAVVDAVLLALFIVQLRRLGRLRKAQTTVLGLHGDRDLVDHATQLAEQVRNMRDAVEALDARLDRHKAELDHAFTLRAVERFDAFHDIGGEQSAAIALLDRHRSGVVISSIHSRDYARLYVKELRDGVADRMLSPEEERVVAAAVSDDAPGHDAGTPAPPRAADRFAPTGPEATTPSLPPGGTPDPTVAGAPDPNVAGAPDPLVADGAGRPDPPPAPDTE